MIIITIIMRVCGDFLCFGSLHSDAGVKPRRQKCGRNFRPSRVVLTTRFRCTVAPLVRGLRRASTTTWRTFECVREREPRVMLFGAGKSHLLMKELRNNGRVVVGFQSQSLVLTLWLHMKSHALRFNSRTWFPSRKN